MIIYFEYALTWVVFMLIITGLCLITPKVAKKIDQWRAEKKNKSNAECDIIPMPDSTDPETDKKP